MATQRKATMEDFFSMHPVFTLAHAVDALQPRGGRAGMVHRLKHHTRRARLKRLARELYAVVPAGQSTDRFQPDVFLVAHALRPYGVFSHHCALELMGAAHSQWNEYTILTENRRPPLALHTARVRFLEHPVSLRKRGDELLGTRQVERSGQLLRHTGPERTLVDGFRRLDLVGGLPELLESVGGFPSLDLDLLDVLLERYATSYLWAAVGWYLERHAKTFYVTEEYLERFTIQCPKMPQYLVKGQRGGRLVARWNLIVPVEVEHMGEYDER